MIRKTILRTIILAALTNLMTSCNHESYEEGEGSLSYLYADYADITITAGKVTSIITDDNARLPLPQNLAASEQLPPDTMLRRLIHYTMTDKSTAVDIVKLTDVSVLLPHGKDEIAEMKTDPVRLTAVWMAQNKRYINLNLGLMVGNSDDKSQTQQVQVVSDSIHTQGRGAVYLTLYHDQAGMPEYYTQEVHISFPLDKLADTAMQPDTISITINTYQGIVTKMFTR